MGNRDGAEPVRILLAEDDDDDFYLTERALKENRLRNQISRVKDGEELLRYLRGSGEYKGARRPAEPSLVLLDLNMPKMDGREALQAIKADPVLRHIPVVVLTTSRAEEDVMRSYEFGVNSFITKPLTFLGLVEAMKALGRYWFEVVALPT